jgi:hypothetical protein
MIASTNVHALKEWAITVRFLGTGRQILLLRKGGVLEQQDGFEVEHEEFFLFPTYLHQNAQALHPQALEEFQTLKQESADRSIRFDTYAQVREVIRVRDLTVLRGLDGMHTLNFDAVSQRFHYRDRPGLHLMLLHVYRLPLPHRVENLPDYDGCVSWVELHTELSTLGAETVLPAAEFERRADQVRDIVGTAKAGNSKLTNRR